LPSQFAVIRWGGPGEPDLIVIYNENWDPWQPRGNSKAGISSPV